MTTGSKSEIKSTFVRNGWQFYDIELKSWDGADTPPSSRPKDKVVRCFRVPDYLIINGKKVLTMKEVTRTRLVPSRSRSLPPHNYVMSAKKYSQDYWLIKDGSISYEGGLINELPHEARWDSNQDLKLLDKVRENIAGSGFNAGVALGESAKSLTMISEHAKRMYLFYRNFRQGNWKKASDELFGGRKLKHPSRKAASNFLAVKYGWMPLLQDVHDGAAFLAHNYNAPRVHRVVTTRKLDQGDARFYDYPYWVHSPGVTVMANIERMESKRVVALLTEVNVPQLSGLQDPASIAWELVPYSFVIDWFIPIGSWLSARSLAQSVTGTYVTTYVNKQRLSSFWIKNSGGGAGAFTRRSSGTWSKVTMERTVATSLPIPPRPQFKPLGSVSSWGRAVTSLALLINVKR